MNKSSLAIIFTIAFCLFVSSVRSQDDIPELILEETEGGYIIVNWEDTRVEDEEPQQGGNEIPELILEETEGGYVIVNWEDTRTEDEESQPSGENPSSGNSNGNGGKTTTSSSTSTKNGKKVRKTVKVSTRKSYRKLRGAGDNN